MKLITFFFSHLIYCRENWLRVIKMVFFIEKIKVFRFFYKGNIKIFDLVADRCRANLVIYQITLF
jgi:hypothetical protein